MRRQLLDVAELSAILHCRRYEGGKWSEIAWPDSLRALGEARDILWGVSPVAPLHFGYDKIFCALASMRAGTGCDVHVLSGDVYAQMSHGVEIGRTQLIGDYYRAYAEDVWRLRGKWMCASSLMFSQAYMQDLLKVSSAVVVSAVKDAWTTEDKATQRIYSFLYPLMQNLDVFHLRPGIVFAETSQEKFYSLLPNVAAALDQDIAVTFAYIAQSHDLRGKTLKSSRSDHRVSVHESPQTLRQKLSHCASLPGEPNCPLTELVLYSLWPFGRETGLFAGAATWSEALAGMHAGVLTLPRDLEMICDKMETRLEQVAGCFRTRPPELTGWIEFSRILAA